MSSETPRDRHHCVIGPGRVGAALLEALPAGGEIVVAVGVSPVTDTEPGADPPRVHVADAVSAALGGERRAVLWLAVPDDALSDVADEAAGALARASSPMPPVAVHLSGLGGLALLDPLAELGATVLSLHPLQSLAAGSGAATLRDVPVAVTAADERGMDIGRRLAVAIGGRPFALSDDDKPLYHLAAVTAANLLVALEAQAADLLAAATGGTIEEASRRLGPLVETTLANLKRHGPSGALTGPVARGDVGTVREHLDELSRQPPRFAQVYRALSLDALALAAPRLDDEAVTTLHRLLGSFDESGGGGPGAARSAPTGRPAR